MHFNKLKLFASAATLFLGLSTPAFADGGVAMSNKCGWNVGIDALYLRANVPDLSYAIVTTNENFGDLISFDHSNALIDPTYDWGFRVQAGYWFPCSCYDINLSYARLNTVDRDSVVAPPGTDGITPAVIVPPFNSFDLAGFNFAAARSRAEFTLNVVDLDAGRHIGCNTYDVRLFGGLRYANVDRDLFTVAEPFPGDLEVISDPNVQYKSYFKGIGPRIGAQGRYGQCCGWGLDADASVAVLIGQLDSHFQANINPLGGGDPVHWNIREAKNCAIPVLEARLGVDYTYYMGCRRNASLVFEAGYQATNYQNVINTPTSLDAHLESINPLTSVTSDVTFNGPYLGVKYYA